MPEPPNVKEAVPFFRVSDMAESVRFYVDGLGFKITHRWEPDGRLRWCRLQHGGAGLMLQEYLTDGHGGRRPEGALGLGVSICFMCEDAVALYREFRGRGVAASRPFVGNAMWVTSLTDPDGYRLEFESPTDAPEESLLPDEDA